MEKQIIVAISREFGSGGHVIAEQIAKDLGLNYYNRNMLDKLAEKHGLDPHYIEKHDEKPKRMGLSRSVRGYTYSNASAVADLQFNFIREKADSGESFVILGRCADSVLAGHKGLLRIFITGNREDKIARVMDREMLDRKEAIKKMERHDRQRKEYYNNHSKTKWGNSDSYDLCINSNVLGIEESVAILEDYIQRFREKL